MVDNSPLDTTLGVILAGGAATRMGGGDKCLLRLGEKTVLAHILARLKPQVADVLLSANGDPARFAGYDLQIVADDDMGQGPIAGLLAGLNRAKGHGLAFCLTVPGDAPLLPRDLARQLWMAMGDAPCAVAMTDGQRQSVFALWRTSALGDIRRLYGDGIRALWRLQEAVGAAEIACASSAEASFQSFNRPEDLAGLAMALQRPENSL
jgi:molybdopterin-guanine dinucleotide biosynthesis protein A